MDKVCVFKDCSKYGEVVHNVVCPRCKTIPRVPDE